MGKSMYFFQHIRKAVDIVILWKCVCVYVCLYIEKKKFKAFLVEEDRDLILWTNQRMYFCGVALF